MKTLSMVLVAVLSGLASVQADNITLKYGQPANTSTNATNPNGNTRFEVNAGSLVVGNQWISLLQPTWSQYSGKVALPGGVLTLTPTSDDLFTPNATASSEIYGSPLDLSLVVDSGYTGNEVLAAGLTDYGHIDWLVSADGTKLSLSGVGLVNVFNAGAAGLFQSIVLPYPTGTDFGAGEAFNAQAGGSNPPAWSQPLTGAPEPSAYVIIVLSVAGAVTFARFRSRA